MMTQLVMASSLAGEKISGIAGHIGARVATIAAPGEVLASDTDRDLAAGTT
jgi:hypothetical protein